MNRNLSAGQFVQPEFEGMPRSLPSFNVQGDNPKHSVQDYGGWNAAHTQRHGQPYDMDNPLPRSRGFRKPGSYVLHQEWVPTERVTTSQDVVTSRAIDHITENADLMALDEDPAFRTTMAGEYEVYDGNHRMNAAARQGRLIMPGQVFRDRLPEGDQDLVGRRAR